MSPDSAGAPPPPFFFFLASERWGVRSVTPRQSRRVITRCAVPVIRQPLEWRASLARAWPKYKQKQASRRRSIVSWTYTRRSGGAQARISARMLERQQYACQAARSKYGLSLCPSVHFPLTRLTEIGISRRLFTRVTWTISSADRWKSKFETAWKRR